MERNQATLFCREQLVKHGLSEWHVRLSYESSGRFLGLCSYKDKAIILNAHHIDIHPEPEVRDTILHEIAHALTPGHRHDEVWANKAREIGCTNTLPCSHLVLSPEIIDAIRSGADVKIEFEEQVIRTPRYEVTRLQDKCKECGKVLVEKSRNEIETDDDTKPNVRFIYYECGHSVMRLIPKGTPFHKLLSSDEKSPYPYQVEGMKFIEQALSSNKGVGIFDEMGLGKTIQALGYLKFHPEAFPVLFVVKSGIKFQWFKEVMRWMGIDYIGQVIQTSQDFLMPGFKSYFMSYDILTPKSRTLKNGKTVTSGMPLEKILALGIKTVVLDECQQIKNPDSTRTQMIRRLVAKVDHVIALSGTPWKNRGSEYFTVLNMLSPTKFGSHQGFCNRWVDYYQNGQYTKAGGIRNPEKFKEYIKDFAIRRERKEVMPELPAITRTMQFVEQDKDSQKIYDEEVSEFVKAYNEMVISGEEHAFGGDGPLIARLARMRHITGLSKIPATEEFVDEFIEETDRKLVIFVHHKDVGEILYKNLSRKYGHEIPVLKLEGGMASEIRSNIQDEFNSYPRCIMIASTLASGEGLNLQTCADCIMHERQWNPANEEQAEGRFIRIGQARDSVTATYMTAAGTVDEFLAGIVEKKRTYFYAAMNKNAAPAWSQSDIIKELTEAIVKDWNDKNKKKVS